MSAPTHEQMYQKWQTWYDASSAELKEQVKTSEVRFVGDEEFRNNFIGKFQQICAEADANGDGVLDRAEFETFQNNWNAWTASQ